MSQIDTAVVIGEEPTGTRISGCLEKASVKVGRNEAAIPGASLVVECFTEGLEARQKRLASWESKAPAGAIMATVAAGGITELAAAAKRPEKVIGLNFTFNPTEDKCVVQVVKGLGTSAETVEACQSLLTKTGATVVVVEDSPGLILDRVMALMINEAVLMYASGIASTKDIDTTTKLCLNWPMGPFEFADTIGLDRVLATLDTLSERLGPQFLPNRLLREMVAMGRLGKKVGQGFYSYK